MTRLTTKEAAAVLRVSTETVRSLAKDRGYLKPITSSGDCGRGQRMYFDAGEVEAFARGGAPAAKAYREERDLKVAPKRGRKVKA